uniref:Uncharacterized protein n=1 Tax=Lactuca sativa TaxID=4236 RepID=A0A9R1XKB5_LACSA|nr:hypothetical protein LSAT_V11C300116720 [Lactuca sativa]
MWVHHVLPKLVYNSVDPSPAPSLLMCYWDIREKQVTKKHPVNYVDPHHTKEEERDIIKHVFDQLTVVRFQEAMPTVRQQGLDDDTRALQAVEATRNVEMGNKELIKPSRGATRGTTTK